ncbi:flagellar protein FlgN [Thiomicrorhabdus indica]|uniref:flagella synthesis protein FlgN n=1 Tax=Thiomicrorhabdus indica TaxID=2267253 RepID=UPI002AA8C163|nr:flagellar protein FlgN [Thiomicrorhabdus indica]
MNQPTVSQNSKEVYTSFDKLLKALDNFLTILNEEKAAIRKSEIKLIEDVTQKKSESVDQIESISIAIEKDTGRSIPEWFADKTLEGNLQNLIQKTENMTTACHDLNLANGLSINILNNMNSYTLNLVSGKDPDMKTYGSKGQENASKDQRRTLGKA